MKTSFQTFFLVLGLFGLSGLQLACQSESPQTKVQTPKTTQKSQKSPKQHFKQALLHIKEKQVSQALKTLQQISKEPQATARLRALSLFHSILLLQEQKQKAKAKKLFGQLQQEYPKQKDLFPQLQASFSPIMQKRITLVFKGISPQKLLHLLASIAKINIAVPSNIPNKKLSISLRNIPWFKALQSVVKLTGHHLETSQQGFVLRPGQRSIYQALPVQIKQPSSQLTQRPVTIQLKAVSFRKAIQLLASIGKVKVSIPTKFPNRKINLSLKKLPWLTALKSIVKGTGYKVKVSGKNYILVPEKTNPKNKR